MLALINEGFFSLGFLPITRGDESDEEEDTDFRVEMYRTRPVFQQRKVVDDDISKEHQRTHYTGLKSAFAFKHIISSNEESRENTVALQSEMNWVSTQIRDLLWDLKSVVERDPSADTARLRREVLDFLEQELPLLLSE